MTEARSDIASDQRGHLNEISKQHGVIEEIIEDIPPAQESPKHILNILCDDCIQAVLLKLDNIVDFFNAALVCTRFQENAQMCFPYKVIDYDPFDYYRFSKCNIYGISFRYADIFFNLFGRFVRSIYFGEGLQHSIVHEYLNLCQKYCGKTLTKLKINGNRCDNKCEYLKLKFEALEDLHLSYTSPLSANQFPKLKILNISKIPSEVNVNWIANIKNLKKIKFDAVKSLTNDIFTAFQNNNPQLEEISIDMGKNLTPVVWQDIGNRLPNIVSLSLSVSQMHTHFFDLCNLQRLREFTLRFSNCRDSLKPFIHLFVENNLPIEKLNFDGEIDIETAESIAKLKLIKILTICHTPDEIVIDIAKKLPALECLNVFRTTKNDSLWMFKKILQNCKNLKKFHFIQPRIKIDLSEYNSIVSLAENRVKVNLICCEKIQNDILNKNNDWVNITFIMGTEMWLIYMHQQIRKL